MTKELTQFGFGGKTIRTFGTKLEPWFAAVDVALALGYKNPYDAISRFVDEDDLVKHEVIDNLGRTQEMSIINESGMYALIFGSNLPTAKKFKRWVTKDVLPSIHKYGFYIDPRCGKFSTIDGKWTLASGEQLTVEQLKQRVLKVNLYLPNIERWQPKDIVYEINQRERYLSMKERYPYTEKDIQKMSTIGIGQEANWYECFIPRDAKRAEYTIWSDNGSLYSEKFVELVREVDKKENSRRT